MVVVRVTVLLSEHDCHHKFALTGLSTPEIHSTNMFITWASWVGVEQLRACWAVAGHVDFCAMQEPCLCILCLWMVASFLHPYGHCVQYRRACLLSCVTKPVFCHMQQNYPVAMLLCQLSHRINSTAIMQTIWTLLLAVADAEDRRV